MTINKYMKSACIAAAALFIIAAVAQGSGYSAELEEGANTVLDSDTVIRGEMDEFSGSMIVVDNIRYRFCKKVEVFSPRNRRISLKNLDAAEEVKLFENRYCIRKIKVLRFAE